MTNEYKNLLAARAAYDADDMNVDLLNALEAAERAYFSAITAARVRYDGADFSETVRESAELNADHTAEENGTTGDRLAWLQVAFSTARDMVAA